MLACSFGAEDVALVDMVHRIDPDAPLFYLDTDFLFPETFDGARPHCGRYGLKPAQGDSDEIALDAGAAGCPTWSGLMGQQARSVLQLEKIEPLTAYSRSIYSAWITGIRRIRLDPGQRRTDRVGQEISARQSEPVGRLEYGAGVDVYSSSTRCRTTSLHDRNYPSIGCNALHRASPSGDDPRSGRWKISARPNADYK